MKIELKGIFDTLEIDNVTSIAKISNNAKNIHRTDNCMIFTNNSFIFFRGLDENHRMYKIEWSYDLENKIKSII